LFAALEIATEKVTGLCKQRTATKIRDFINGWNSRKHPFIWTKTPDEILTNIERKKTSLTRH
jgi:hypothetical protein